MSSYATDFYSLDAIVRDDWGSGFVSDWALTRLAPEADSGWTISFDLGHQITNIWGAEVLAHEGTRYTIGNASWNGNVDPDESIAFGFQATASGADLREPISLVIDGVTATAGGTVPEPTPSPEPQPEPVPSPEISIGDADLHEGDPTSFAPGYLHAEGNQIVDADGTPVRIAGVNWFGFESTTLAPHGLWTRNYEEMMGEMKAAGFNTIRLPFSNEALDTGKTPNGIDFAANPDLAGLSPIEIMDRVVEAAGDLGLRIILDLHRNDAGVGALGDGLWYSDRYPESRVIDDWQMLAERYAGNPTVIGADLYNEPHGASWGSGDAATDWQQAAERIGNAILEVNADWLVFVEGVGTVNGESYWWGGNLQGVADDPVQLTHPEKLIYSAHAYPNSIYAQPWFSDPRYPDNLPEIFDENWGYVFHDLNAPVLVGEFGSKLQDPKDLPWMQEFLAYLGGDRDGDGISDLAPGEEGISWTYWSWNPNSGDTGGILADDWRTPIQEKLDLLAPHMADLPEASGNGSGMMTTRQIGFDVLLDSAAEAPLTLSYTTADGSATAGEDYAAASGTVTFAPGEVAKRITVTVNRDFVEEGDETFLLHLKDASGNLIGTATGTIKDDDSAVPEPTPDPHPTPDPEPGPGPVPQDGPADLILTNSWGDGFTAEIAVQNQGVALDGWQLEVELPFEIVNIWNAEIIDRDGDRYLIGDAGWNSQLAAGSEVRFGLQGGLVNGDDEIVLTGAVLSHDGAMFPF